MATSITVRVNDCDVELPAGATVQSLVEHVGVEARGTAVARNGEIAPRSQWPETRLADGDHIELLSVARGG